jgi:hypothetical protein
LDAIVPEIEADQLPALSQHSCKALCPACADVIAAEIEVSQRCALRQQCTATILTQHTKVFTRLILSIAIEKMRWPARGHTCQRTLLT